MVAACPWYSQVEAEPSRSPVESARHICEAADDDTLRLIDAMLREIPWPSPSGNSEPPAPSGEA